MSIPLFPPGTVRQAFVDVTYEDERNGYHREERLEIPGTATEPVPLRIALLDPTLRKFRHRVTIVTTDGQLIQQAPVDGEETIIGVGRALRDELEAIAGALGRTVPPTSRPPQRSSGERLAGDGRSLEPADPDRLPDRAQDPDGDPILRWAAEIAGPEIADARRLGLVATRLAAAGQPVSPPLLEAIQAVQQGRDLWYGAWLGGRAIDDGPAAFQALR